MGRLQYKTSRQGKYHWKVAIWPKTQSGEGGRDNAYVQEENSRQREQQLEKYLAYLKDNKKVSIAGEQWSIKLKIDSFDYFYMVKKIP